MDFWIFRFRKARETYSDLQNIVGNLDLWIMPYVQLGQRNLNRWHQYQTEEDHWQDRNCEPYGTRHSNPKKVSTKRIYMLPFVMWTKQNEKPKMENAFLFWKLTFRSKKKYIYIFLRYHGHPDRSIETICKWKRYSTQNMKPKREYTKNHTVFNASLVASLSKALPWLSKNRFIRSKLQSRFCYQGSYGITCLMTKTLRNCSSCFLHYIVNLNRMHHVRSIKDELRGDNENAFFLCYYFLLESPMITIVKKQVALWYLSHLEVDH
jgi:hypothetical protein